MSIGPVKVPFRSNGKTIPILIGLLAADIRTEEQGEIVSPIYINTLGRELLLGSAPILGKFLEHL